MFKTGFVRSLGLLFNPLTEMIEHRKRTPAKDASSLFNRRGLTIVSPEAAKECARRGRSEIEERAEEAEKVKEVHYNAEFPAES